MNIDTRSLRESVKNFKFYGGPSNSSDSAPATVKDVKDVVDDVAALLNEFIDELESAD